MKHLKELWCQFEYLTQHTRPFYAKEVSAMIWFGLVWLFLINVDLAIFQPYLDLEAGDNQSLKIQVARRGIGYEDGLYILILTLWSSNSKSSRLYETGILYPVFFTLRTRKHISSFLSTISRCIHINNIADDLETGCGSMLPMCLLYFAPSACSLNG